MSDFLIRQYNTDDEKDVIELWSECGLLAPQNNPKLDIERKLKVDFDDVVSMGKRLEHDNLDNIE